MDCAGSGPNFNGDFEFVIDCLADMEPSKCNIIEQISVDMQSKCQFSKQDGLKVEFSC